MRELADSDANNCTTCYWAFPERYTHIAMRQIRRLDIIWSGEEALEYDTIAQMADGENLELPEFVKAVIRHHLEASG